MKKTYVAWPILIGGAVVVAALSVSASLAAHATAPAPSPLRGGVTSLRFNAEILADLGIELVDVAETSAPLRHGALGFALDIPGSTVALDGVGGDFEGFAATDLRHAGGFALRVDGVRVDLAGFRLTSTASRYTLELRDAQDRRWLFVDKPHAVLAPDGLSISNADLVIAPEFAALIGRPDLSGSYIGVLDAELSLELAESGATASEALAAGECVGDFTRPVDLLMVDISGMTQSAREPGGRVALAPSATVRNLGPGDVQWFRTIAPLNPVGPHPYLVLNFYRLSGGVLEQIGRSDLKHAFFATNTGCSCGGGQILYAGCGDVYGAFTNLDRMNFAPRNEINAFTLSWSSRGSHFDGLPVDDFLSHGGDFQHDNFEHLLVVREPDLQTPGARYFYDGWYMAPNDSNLANSMGHREVAPAFAGSTWSFPTIDAGTANGSILDVLVDPRNVRPGEATQLVDTGAGRVQLAVVTRNLGGGVFHYEYALMNFDFERQIRKFSLRIGPGQIVSNAGFGDADGNPQNDWTPSVAGGLITWTAPAGNALDWGTLYNFRVDADAAPVVSAATLTPLDAGSPTAVVVRTLPEPGSGASIGSALTCLALLARPRHRPPSGLPKTDRLASWLGWRGRIVSLAASITRSEPGTGRRRTGRQH
jgi:hypothetical protein